MVINGLRTKEALSIVHAKCFFAFIYNSLAWKLGMLLS